MAYTNYKMIKAPINQIEALIATAIAEGWQPFGGPFVVFPADREIYQAVVKGTPDSGGSAPAPEEMTAQDAETGTSTTAMLISPEVLANEIDRRIALI